MSRFTSVMRILFCTLVLVSFTFSIGNSQGKPDKPKSKVKKEKTKPGSVEMKNFNDSISYAIGTVLAESFKMQLIDSLNLDLMMTAMRTGLDKKPHPITLERANAILQEMNQRLSVGKEEQRRQAMVKSNAEGTAWLAENAKKPGVVTMENGLQYKIITEGTGPKPTLESEVTCHYKGTLIDGTKFDSSYDRGEPATFPLKGVIPGWQHGLQLMSVGSKYMLYIPADMGYGGEGVGGTIPPNSVLIFEVELISIK